MLATLLDFKLYLWITGDSQDTLLTLFLSSADQMIKSYIGRDIEVKDYTEYLDWNAQKEIILANYPVNTLTSISRNTWTLQTPIWEALEQTTYKLSPNVWKIFLVYALYRGFQNYKIVYNAWYSSIPADLQLACIKIASKYYNSRTSDWITSESVNGDSLDFDTYDLPNDILVILDNYRDINV